MDNNQLTHHGVKGMKWGVRRSPAQLGHKPSSKKGADDSDDVFKLTDAERKNLSNKFKSELTDWAESTAMVGDVARLFPSSSNTKLPNTVIGMLDKISESRQLKAARTRYLNSLEAVVKAYERNLDEKTITRLENELSANADMQDEACQKAADKLLGKYGNVKIADQYDYRHKVISGNDQVHESSTLSNELATHLRAYQIYYVQALDPNPRSKDDFARYVFHSQGGGNMNDQLTHHGIKGMKWGVRRSPAQLGHKPSSKTKKSSLSLSERIAAKKKLKAKQKAAEVAREAKQTKEEFEAEKKKAIESGTAADVLKFKGKLTNQELNTAVGRLNMEAQLSQLDAKTKKTGMDKMEEAANKIDRIRGAAEKGISAWNTFAKIHNSLSPNDLPTLDGNYKDRAEAKREKAEKKAKEARDKAMKKLVESGTPEEIAAQFGKFTVNELKDANSRFGFEDQIKKRMKKQYSSPQVEKTEMPNSGMKTRKFKRKDKGKTTGSDDDLGDLNGETVDTPSGYIGKKSTTYKTWKKRNVYESTFRDISDSETTSSGQAYVDRLLGPGTSVVRR